MKPNITFKFFLSLFSICLIGNAFAQITIDNTSKTVTQLVDGTLIPSGKVTSVSNVSFKGVRASGNGYQVGYFTTAGTTKTQMGFDAGIVISTGNTSSIPLNLGVHPGSVSQMSKGYLSSTQNEIRQGGTSATFIKDLDILAGNENYYNAAIIEFDFVPLSDKIQFRYIFGSEEYMDDGGFINYNCTDYFDKFGFLISGPGVSGGQGYDNNARNIARLSNGSEVSVNSVNNGQASGPASNCTSANPDWVENQATAEFLGIIDGTQLNGNTKILIASQSGLIPGQTYHIKLIVTDVKDGGYDSVVYLEAGSFTTEPTDVSAGPDQTVCKDTTSLNASTPLIGTWTVASGAGTFANDKDPKTKVSGLQLGINTFVWTSTADGKSDTVKITYSTTPIVISYNPSIISNSSTNAVAVTQSGVVNGTYSATPAGLTINTSTGEITPNTSDPGTYVVEVNTACGKDTATVVITSSDCGETGFNGYKNGLPYNLPTTFTCSDTADYGMRANDQLIANGFIAPGFTIKYDAGISISSIEINENNTGFQSTFTQKVITYCVPTYEYQIKLTGVSGSGNVWLEDHATGVKYLVTAATANMTITIPVGSIKGSSIFSGSGVSNVKLNKANTFIGSGYGVFNPSKAGSGQHTIYYTWDNGLGCSGVHSLIVNVQGPANTPSIGKDTLLICGALNVKIDTLNKIFDPAFIWYDASSGGSPLDPTAVLEDKKTYYASQKIGGCESGQRDSVLVIFENPIKPIAESNLVNFCIVEYKTLADLVVDGTDIKWYTTPKGGNELPLTTLLDSITYYVSQTIGLCESRERDSVVVKLRDTDKPTLKDPNLFQPLIFCSFPRAKIDTLKNYIIGNNLKYYKDSIKGKSLNPNDTLKTGIYYISQKPENKCESSHRLAISVVIGDTTHTNLNVDTLSFCPSENPTVANLLPSKTDVTWYDVALDGSALLLTTPLENGKKYYAAQLVNACESSYRDSVLVVFKGAEVPVGNSSLSFCASKRPAVSDLLPVGVDVKWYNAPSDGVLLNSQDILENGKTYFATKKTGTCESSSRLAVTITLEDPIAGLSVTSATTVCKGKTATIEVANPLNGATYNIYSTFNATTPIATAPYSFTPTNDTIYYVQAISAGGCTQLKPGTPVLIRVNPLPKSPNVISSSITVCSKSSLVLSATSAQPNVAFSWTGPNNFSSNLQNPLLSNNPDSTLSGKYYVSVTDKTTGCVSAKSDSLTVKVISLKAAFTPSTINGFIPLKVAFANESVNGINYFWNFKDGSTTTEKSPEHIFEKEGVYQVYMVAYNGGCIDTVYSDMIEVNRTSKLEIPNVFTPNNDNKNDVFNIKGDGLKTISAKMYNRWGQLVYEWETLGGGWNGTTLAGINAPDGTYFYVINAVGNDGVPYNFKGHVDLIR